MSELLEKAKKLINETGCDLSTAANALRESSNDYDLALALVLEKQGKTNYNHKPTNNYIKEEKQMEEPASQKIEIDVEEKKNDSDIQIEDTEEDLEDAISSIKKSSVATSLIIIIFAAALSLYEINSFLEILNMVGSFEGLLANNLFIIVKYGLIILLCFILIIMKLSTLLRLSKIEKDLKEIKENYPNHSVNTIKKAYKRSNLNINKVDRIIDSIEKSEALSKDLKDLNLPPRFGVSIALTYFGIVCFIGGWIAACMMVDESGSATDMNSNTLICLAAAGFGIIFLLIGSSTFKKIRYDIPDRLSKSYRLVRFILIVFGFFLPAIINYNKWILLITRITAWIVIIFGIIVVIFILSSIGGRGSTQTVRRTRPSYSNQSYNQETIVQQKQLKVYNGGLDKVNSIDDLGYVYYDRHTEKIEKIGGHAVFYRESYGALYIEKIGGSYVKYGSGDYIEYIGNYKVNHDSYGNIYSIGDHKCHY